MKVDVNISKRPGVRVEINLVHGRPRHRVSIPVRVAPYLAEDFDELTEPIEAVPLDEVEEIIEEEELLSEEAVELFDDDEQPDEIVEDEPEESFDPQNIYADADPDEEELLRLIAEEEAEMAASGHSGISEQLPEGHYMRYLDRSVSGDIFEVDDSHAIGQKIICIDGESGRLSRVCGIIKHNPATANDTPADTDE